MIAPAVNESWVMDRTDGFGVAAPVIEVRSSARRAWVLPVVLAGFFGFTAGQLWPLAAHADPVNPDALAARVTDCVLELLVGDDAGDVDVEPSGSLWDGFEGLRR